MTGDGINDTPALKRADVGIAVSNATDVAKDVSKMILLDNNFTNIIEAIKEGRNIYENIKRFIFFSLSGNIGKTITLLVLPLLCLLITDNKLNNIIIPLMPIQLLWLNLITDGLIGLSFGFEQPEKDIMKRKPVSLSVGIFDNIPNLISNSLMIGILSMVPAFIYWKMGSNKWQTILFTMLAFTHIFQALTIRTKDYFYKSFNVVMLYVFGFIIVSQITITQIEELRVIFDVVKLDVSDFIICFVFSIQMLVFEFNKGEK
jgi:Ca2+-transporting ATPase